MLEKTALRVSLSRVSLIVVRLRSVLSASKRPSTLSSAFATLIASAAPNISPMNPVTSPAASRLSFLYLCIRPRTMLTMITTKNIGTKTPKVISASMRAMMKSATGRKNMWDTKNLNCDMYIATTLASSRKRLTASPVELGSERCPGRVIR